MIQIPPDILNKYKHALSQKSISVQKHSYLIKWFQYYWDFCMKYNFNKNNPKSLPRFIKKLESKRQSKFSIITNLEIYHVTPCFF